MNVIYHGTRTTLKDLGQFVGVVAQQLYDTAAKERLLPTGPLQWIYTGADGRPDTEFTLEIALPVNGRLSTGSGFAQKELPAFECLAVTHQGAWDHLFETYDRAIDELHTRGKQMNGVCREQYVYMDFNEPKNNVTEVMIGVAP